MDSTNSQVNAQQLKLFYLKLLTSWQKMLLITFEIFKGNLFNYK
jgi:hypothetical protein